VRYYDLELKGTNGEFAQVARLYAADSSFVDNVSDFNSMAEYCYRVTAHRMGPFSNPDANLAITSVSNEACVPTRSLIYVPNVFTPNGDGVNDIFMAKGMYISKFSMQIFDRWGTRVFQSDKLNEGWDGRYKNSTTVLDAYRYLIVALGVDGKHHFVSGWVTVMR
jgi:gliding motility-associated-like protein